MAEKPADFRIHGRIEQVEVIARGAGVRVRDYLTDKYGGGKWRKMKGIALVEDDNGYFGKAEIHWFEAHGIGRVGWKIKERFHRR